MTQEELKKQIEEAQIRYWDGLVTKSELQLQLFQIADQLEDAEFEPVELDKLIDGERR